MKTSKIINFLSFLVIISFLFVIGCTGQGYFLATTPLEKESLQEEIDTDSDGIADTEDNCPNVENPEQKDADENGIGDLCEEEEEEEEENSIPKNIFYKDADGDKFGDSNESVEAYIAPEGYVLDATDCDDTDATVFPNAYELCDGKPNNCNEPDTPEDEDNDGDGFTECMGDCNDNNATVYAGAPELCDGLNNACSGLFLEDEIDDDEDGQMPCEGDCNDDDPRIYFDADEVCDGLDNNCDGFISAEEVDDDEDGFLPCEGDCDFEDARMYPGAKEACDGLDNDCDGVIPANEIDKDGDGFSECEGDCNDLVAEINPDAAEICNGEDNNCNGYVGNVDSDGDGYSECDDVADCNDNDDTIYPGAPEGCNGIDNDCDGDISTEEEDGDEDGFKICDGDCDDDLEHVYPGAEEVCDGLDSNCDGIFLSDDLDSDGDGIPVCAGDCNDDYYDKTNECAYTAPNLNSIASPTNERRPTFSWENLEWDHLTAYYDLEISADKDFNDTETIETNPQETSFTPSEDFSGVYYWRVRVRDSGGRIGEWSNSEIVQIMNLTVYEDAEDGRIDGWDIYSNSAGASFANVYDDDRESFVIETTNCESGTPGCEGDTGFRLRDEYGNEFNNTTHFFLRWSTKSDGAFSVYAKVTLNNDPEDDCKVKYFRYQTLDYDQLLTINPLTMMLGIGWTAGNNTWQTFTRNLQLDLHKSPECADRTIVSVDDFRILGDVRVDDIMLLEEPTIYQPGDHILDSDSDRLSDYDEIIHGTDPAIADADGDGYGDGDEIMSGTDAFDDSDYPNYIDFENAEDGFTLGWDIYDRPEGAFIENVFDEDRGSRVIKFTGCEVGTPNCDASNSWWTGYRLRREDGTDWNNTTNFFVQWSMKYSGNFTVYVVVTLADGTSRNLSYTAANSNLLLLSNGNSIEHGLGYESKNGTWQTFTRDIVADLNEAPEFSDATIISVDRFLIRGNGMADDIRFYQEMPE